MASSKLSSSKRNNKNKNITFITIYPYHGNIKKNQLTFPTNVKIVAKTSENTTTSTGNSGWWWGKCIETNQVGWFPISYVKQLDEQNQAFSSLMMKGSRAKVSCLSTMQQQEPTSTTTLTNHHHQKEHQIATAGNSNDNNEESMDMMGGISTAKAGTGVRMMTSPYLNDDDNVNTGDDDEDDRDDSNNYNGSRSSNSDNKKGRPKIMKQGIKKLKSRFSKKNNDHTKKEVNSPHNPSFSLFTRKVPEEDPFKPVVKIIDSPSSTATAK